jgi:hypothetical protein
MKVKNLNNTSKYTCKCKSWFAHWKNFSNQNILKCAVLNCNNLAEFGGHIQKISLADRHWYIIPICSHCNNQFGKELEIDDNIKLVSANIEYTCK